MAQSPFALFTHNDSEFTKKPHDDGQRALHAIVSLHKKAKFSFASFAFR